MKTKTVLAVLGLFIFSPLWAQETPPPPAAPSTEGTTRAPTIEEIEELEWQTMPSEKTPIKKKKKTPSKKKMNPPKEETKKEAAPEVKEEGPPKVVNEPVPMPIPSGSKGPAPEAPAPAVVPPAGSEQAPTEDDGGEAVE